MEVSATVTMESTSGLPEDRFVNTFAFDGGSVPWTAAERAAVFVAIQDVYNFDNPGVTGSQPAAYLSAEISRVAPAVIRLYDINAPGSPFAELSFVLAPALPGSALPSEVAICMSFHADLAGVAERLSQPPAGPAGDIKPRSQRRGRIYFGPLNTNAATAASPTRPTDDIIGQLRAAGENLIERADLDVLGIDWCVWSRTNNFTRAVTGGWVDNSFDTQRRRGRGPTARGVFPIPV